MTPDTIEREITIAAPPETVWSIITEADQISQWFGDEATIDLRPGGAATFTFKSHDVVSQAEVVTVEPHTRFAYRWISGRTSLGETVTDTNSTLVEFNLSPEGEGTRLRLVESGFSKLDGSEDENTASLEGNTRGWAAELGDLVEFAEGRAAVNA